MDTIAELIRRRRRQMVIHSYIYYRLGTSIISDDQWQTWANELVDLQRVHPKLKALGCYDKIFKGWTGTTGMDLPAGEYERGVAEWLLRTHNDLESGKWHL